MLTLSTDAVRWIEVHDVKASAATAAMIRDFFIVGNVLKWLNLNSDGAKLRNIVKNTPVLIYVNTDVFYSDAILFNTFGYNQKNYGL